MCPRVDFHSGLYRLCRGENMSHEKAGTVPQSSNAFREKQASARVRHWLVRPSKED